MNSYPDSVAKIVDDYMSRMKLKLRGLPAGEQAEFVMEIHSHIHEAYSEMAGDEVARILAVLRNLGEPADVVSDRLPGTLVRSGTKLKLPLYILGGILVAMLGVPLGVWGIGTAIGLLSGLAGLLIAYYAVAGSTLLIGGAFLLLGLIRIGVPALFDRLVALGYIRLGPPDGPFADLINQMSPAAQGLILIAIAAVFIATGIGMLWLGKHMLRGLRFLGTIIYNRLTKLAQTVRTKLRRRKSGLFTPEPAAAIK